MQRTLIYLSELDSVRKSKQEILFAQQKLYEAITDQGFSVVVPFNQLTDSLAFLGPIISERSEFIMDFYMALFQNGSLKISRYVSPDGKKEIRTAAQYVLNYLESAINADKKSNSFLFSSLPIARDNTDVLQTLFDSIKNCDLSLLDNLSVVNSVDRAYIKRYVKWMLDLSIQTSFYIDVKDHEYLTFVDYLDTLLAVRNISILGENLPSNFPDALQILRKAKPAPDKNMYSRSNWLNNIDIFKDSDPDATNLAKEIVNLCYNLSVESSIKGIEEKYHTDINAFISEVGKHIIGASEAPGNRGNVLTIELQEFPDWEHAVHITNEAANVLKQQQKHTSIGILKWESVCKKGQQRKFFGACIYFLLLLAIDFALGVPEMIADIMTSGDITFTSAVMFILKNVKDSLFVSVLSTSVVSFTSSKISEKLAIPDITDIAKSLKEVCIDCFKLSHNQRNSSGGKQ